MWGIAKRSKRLGREGVKMKEDRAICEKTKNPGTGSFINAQRGECRNHNLRLDMIEKMGKVKKEYPTHPIGGDSVSGFEM